MWPDWMLHVYGSLHPLFGRKTLQVLAEIWPNGVSYEIVPLHPVWKVPVALKLAGFEIYLVVF